MKKTRKLLTLFLTCILLLSFTSFPVFATDGTLVYGYDDFQVVIDEVNEPSMELILHWLNHSFLLRTMVLLKS